jgi:hypothetical protein
MAALGNARLTLTRDTAKKTVRAVATVRITFTQFEVNQMQQGLQFRLRAKLMGADSGLFGADDDLFTYTPAKFYPDATPNSVENATFDVTLGEEVLNEDLGTDEIYATFELTNLFTLVRVNRKSPEVTGNF